jgi:arylsulfatase A-like enzyme
VQVHTRWKIKRCCARGRAHSGCGTAALRLLRFFAAIFATASRNSGFSLRPLLCACLATLLWPGIAVTAATVPAKPNIIFILADDYGWADLGCYGSTFYETPNLDRLAKQGVRFTDAHAACNVCSPTRASIMTGKYPARLHLTDWLPGRPDRPDQKLNRPVILQHLPLEEVTIAEALKDGGYATAFLGKWHLGGPGFYPDQQGFDVNIGGCELGHPPSYFSPYKIPTLSDGPPGEYLTDRLTDEALKFMETARNKPFFLYLSHYAVHTPLQAKPNLLAKYKAKAAQLTPAGPEFITDLGRQVRQIQNHATYAAMVESLDDSIGRIMNKLQELGIEQNTVVIFTSDNGGLSTAEGTPTSNLPLRMGKGWNFEGGVREPLLVKWPGVTRPGTRCDAPMISTDYYPTLLELAGLSLRPLQHLDGVSLVPLLRGGAQPERPLFWHYPHYSNQGGGPGGAVRLGDFKLIEWFEDMRVQLFNLKDDIGELHDLASQMPEKANALREQLHAWRRAVDAQMMTPNPDYRSDAPKSGGGKKKKTGKQSAAARQDDEALQARLSND